MERKLRIVPPSQPEKSFGVVKFQTRGQREDEKIDGVFSDRAEILRSFYIRLFSVLSPEQSTVLWGFMELKTDDELAKSMGRTAEEIGDIRERARQTLQEKYTSPDAP